MCHLDKLRCSYRRSWTALSKSFQRHMPAHELSARAVYQRQAKTCLAAARAASSTAAPLLTSLTWGTCGAGATACSTAAQKIKPRRLHRIASHAVQAQTCKRLTQVAALVEQLWQIRSTLAVGVFVKYCCDLRPEANVKTRQLVEGVYATYPHAVQAVQSNAAALGDRLFQWPGLHLQVRLL